MEKESKLKFQKFWELVPTFVEVTGEKRIGMRRGLYSPTPILNRVEKSHLVVQFGCIPVKVLL